MNESVVRNANHSSTSTHCTVDERVSYSRAPVPDRLMLPEDMMDIPLAPPTPPVPNNSGNQTGGGANRTSAIFKGPPKGSSSSAPSEIPRDNVTRTPEDQLAPPPYPSQGPR